MNRHLIFALLLLSPISSFANSFNGVFAKIQFTQTCMIDECTNLKDDTFDVELHSQNQTFSISLLQNGTYIQSIVRNSKDDVQINMNQSFNELGFNVSINDIVNNDEIDFDFSVKTSSAPAFTKAEGLNMPQLSYKEIRTNKKASLDQDIYLGSISSGGVRTTVNIIFYRR